jgi:hypothetical protein
MRAAGLLSFTKGRLRVMDWPRLADLAEMTETPAPSSAVLPSPTLQPDRPDRWREGVWRNASTQIQ